MIHDTRDRHWLASRLQVISAVNADTDTDVSHHNPDKLSHVTQFALLLICSLKINREINTKLLLAFRNSLYAKPQLVHGHNIGFVSFFKRERQIVDCSSVIVRDVISNGLCRTAAWSTLTDTSDINNFSFTVFSDQSQIWGWRLWEEVCNGVYSAVMVYCVSWSWGGVEIDVVIRYYCVITHPVSIHANNIHSHKNRQNIKIIIQKWQLSTCKAD